MIFQREREKNAEAWFCIKAQRVAVSNGEAKGPLRSGEEAGARAIRDDVPVHPQGDGEALRVQIDPEEEAYVPGGLR